MLVSGYVEGLRKGTLYLQKLNDTVLVTVDSFQIKGDDHFKMGTDIETPEFFFLSLNKSNEDSLTDKILFFGEKGEIKINTLLKTYVSSAKIEGSVNQKLWEEYQGFLRKFNQQNLDLYQQYLAKEGDFVLDNAAELFETKKNNLIKRKYLYSLNFAINNADKEVAAYIGAYEVNNSIPLYLDSLYNNLSAEVKSSKYGKAFKKQLDSLERK